jgi:hypothetical protein
LVIGNLEVWIGRRVASLDVPEYPVSEVEVDRWACDPVKDAGGDPGGGWVNWPVPRELPPESREPSLGQFVGEYGAGVGASGDLFD